MYADFNETTYVKGCKNEYSYKFHQKVRVRLNWLIVYHLWFSNFDCQLTSEKGLDISQFCYNFISSTQVNIFAKLHQKIIRGLKGYHLWLPDFDFQLKIEKKKYYIIWCCDRKKSIAGYFGLNIKLFNAFWYLNVVATRSGYLL